MRISPVFHVENLHSQIVDDLIRRIVSGALVTGDALPAEALMATEYGVSAGTLRRAIGHVAELRLLIRSAGGPTNVADATAVHKSSATISTVDRDGTRVDGDTTQHNVRIERSSDAVASMLRQRSPRPILRFERHRFYLGRRYMVEGVYLPVRPEDLNGNQGQLAELARALWWKREVAQAKHETLWLGEAHTEDTALLDVPSGQSVLCIDRTLFGARNLPLEYRVGRCNLGTDLFYASA